MSVSASPLSSLDHSRSEPSARAPDPRGRFALLVLFLALAAYANSLGNAFAYDDEGIVTQNATVTAADWRGALSRPWWPQPLAGGGLYRPVTSASFALEWGLFDGAAVGFHAVNVLAHALVSLLVFALLASLASPAGALVGGAVFAIHPVHTEAVANVVGRAELYAAAFYLAACLLYWHGRRWRGAARGARLIGLGALYFAALASKEIGVTLPGALLLLELQAARSEPSTRAAFGRGVRAEAATWIVLALAVAAYLGARFLVLGSVMGEQVAPTFQVVGPTARVLTAIAVWLQYLRLLLFPADLASDYDPGVMFPSETLDAAVIAGAGCLAALAIVAAKAWRETPLVTLGIAFFGVAILPVSNLLFATGSVLAERTLYLPSVGLSLVAAGLTAPVLDMPRSRRRVLVAAAAVAAAALFVRTVVRNPAWMDTFVVLQTLSEEHPESWRAFRGRAQGLQRVGDLGAAAAQWDQAVRLAPTNYTLLVQAGDFHGRVGDPARAADYFGRAIALDPRVANAYQHLSGLWLKQGRGRDAHRVALEGLARAGHDPVLWERVSEAYAGKGDLAAAIRARAAAIGAGPGTPAEWRRIAELWEAAGEPGRALEARGRAQRTESRP